MSPQKKSWGGKWTEEKLDAFEKYVNAYLTIMNANRDLYGWRLLYFDGFAGSGSRFVAEEAEDVKGVLDLFGQEIDPKDFCVYQGAAERVVQIEGKGIKSFDQYYFIDNSPENCMALEHKLAPYHTEGKRHHLAIDANDAVQRLARTLKKSNSFKALAFLDPFGMQIDWASINALKGLSVDLWILVPTGVIINRLLERKIDKEKGFIHANKLESFFGMSQEDILKHFYRESQELTLFGDEETVITKAEDSIRRIAELYVDRLKTVFPNVVEEPMVLYNSQNVPIYHLVFASKKDVARRIAQDIIRHI